MIVLSTKVFAELLAGRVPRRSSTIGIMSAALLSIIGTAATEEIPANTDGIVALTFTVRIQSLVLTRLSSCLVRPDFDLIL